MKAGEVRSGRRRAGLQRRAHPVCPEVKVMPRRAAQEFMIDLRPAIEYIGLEQFIEQVGRRRIIDCICQDRRLARRAAKVLVKRLGIDGIVANLSPAQRRELKRRLQ
jgi:hypothetical protein